MTLARNIAIFTIAVSSLTFIAFFGRLPALRNTPIGWLHRLLVLRIPALLHRVDVVLTNGRTTSSLSRLAHYLANEKHPLVIVFFLGLVTGSAALFIPEAYGALTFLHKMWVVVLLPLPYIFTYLSARRASSPYITSDNHSEHMRHYPYDRILFYPGSACRTCNFLKPARSKHCPICKHCVARMDHHCIWVNNCLGRGNYKWFLALLLSTSVLLMYGAYLAYVVIAPRVHQDWAKYGKYYAFKPSPGSDPDTWRYTFDAKTHNVLMRISIALEVGGLRLSGVGLLCLLTWPLPLALFGYHIYLIWAGTTTNESSKWADWRDEMDDGTVFLGQRRQDTMGVSPPQIMTEEERDQEPSTDWPLQSRHILLRTEDGEPPKALHPRIKSVLEPGSLKRVWTLSDVENVYDLGFWDNLVDMIK